MLVIEVLSSGLFALGVGLLLAAAAIRLMYGSWTRTQAITFEHEGHPYLRWHDNRYRIVEALWSSGIRRRKQSPPPPALPPGEDVVIFYLARHPVQWSLEQPYRGTRRLAVLGLVSAVAGTLLGFVPS